MMIDSVSTVHMRMGILDKFLLLAAISIAIALFLTIGWMAIAPDDPRGAVSLIARRDSLMVILQAGLLAAVSAAIATVMVGAKLADVGAFAAAIGMALVSLQGETAAYLLINTEATGAGAPRMLAFKLATESLVWFALVVVALLVSGIVTRWCVGLPAEPVQSVGGQSARQPGVGMYDLAISECPVIARLLLPTRDPMVSGHARGNGLRTLLVTTIAGLLIYGILVSGSSPHSIRHGQTCFAVFSAFYVGTWIARRTYPARTAFWSILAVPMALLAGYGWTVIAGAPHGRFAHLAMIPATDFLRALPLTFISVGALGTLTAQWTILPATATPRDARRTATGRKPTGRRDGA